MVNSEDLEDQAISPTIVPRSRPVTVLTSHVSVKTPTVFSSFAAPNHIRIPARPPELLRCHAKNLFTDETLKHRGTWNYHKPGTVEC
jgi:hypothetical protein